MERGVVVFLRIGHPRDRIDARQDRLDPSPVFGRDRVHVRQVEDRDRPEIGGAVLADLVDAQPLEQRFERGPLGGRDPGHGHARGRSSHGRRADGLTGQGVEQARLADAGAADEGQHVGVAREPHASNRIGVSGPDGLGLDAERLGGVGGLEQRREASVKGVRRPAERIAAGRRDDDGHPPAGRQRADRCRRGAQISRKLGQGACSRQQSIETSPLLVERLGQGILQPGPRVGDQLGHRRLPEQGREQLLVEERRRRGDADLGAGQPAGVDERPEHDPRAQGR